LTLPLSASFRVDPRAVTGLTDNILYAVTITETDGTVAAVVSELNFEAGDGAIAYEGFAAP
jgi:hypothetical protein